MITASYIPLKYNGDKGYGADGCQMIIEAIVAILAEIKKLEIFADVRMGGDAFKTACI